MKAARVLIVTGAGGVGKTTLSAGIAATMAAVGDRTLVVTVDPARRLADALGIHIEDSGSNRPSPVPGALRLDALMLDVTASWEAITRRHTKPDIADRLVGNPYFRAVADRFPAAQSYAAGEQIAEFAQTGAWDAVVVDTPPAAGGLDFFTAPRRMRDLVGGRMLRILTGSRIPGRRLLYRATARPVLRIADSLLGSALLEEIAEFLLDLRSLYDGLAARAADIERLFKESTVLVATTDAPGPVREADRFFTALPEIDVDPAGLIFNRALPDSWIGRNGPRGSSPQDRLLRENLQRWALEARRNRDARITMAARLAIPMATVPWMRHPPNSVSELTHLVASSSGFEQLINA